jgi:hypothetical protein
MPEYFFDIANQDFVRRDHQGRELASLDVARAVAGAELRNWIGDGQFDGGYWLEIRDAGGALLARLDPAPDLSTPPGLSDPNPGEAAAGPPASEGELLLAIMALRRTLARLKAHGEEDAEDSDILEVLKASYAERMAAQITRAASPRG